MIVYGVGFVVVLIGLGLSLLSWSMLPQRLAEGRLLDLMKALDSKVVLRLTQCSGAPFACGFFKRRIMLPMEAEAWTDRRVTSTLAHEMAHLERRDPLARLLASVIRAVFWFHPLVWLAHRQLILAQEEACDVKALERGIAPADYAEDLLKLAAINHQVPRGSLAMAGRSELGKRVERVLDPIREPGSAVWKMVLLGAAALILTVTGFAGNPKEEEELREGAGGGLRGEIRTSDGVVLATSKKEAGGKPVARSYPTAESTAHLLGYVGRVAPGSDEMKGRAGLEKFFDEKLSQGKDVQLTIDSKFQQRSFDLLKEKGKPGAIIVSNPESGAILAMASWPSYDPSLFHPTITMENFKKLQDDKQKPLFPRASQGLYPPASTAKIIGAAAAGLAGLGNPEIHCEGYVQYGSTRIRDWKTYRNETLTIPSALETSCNTYFIQLVDRVGEEPMRKAGKLLGIGQPGLSEIPTGKPLLFLPADDSDKVSRITLALAAIGHGQTLMSPLDVNVMTSAIATGVWNQPHLVNDEKIERSSHSLIGPGKLTEEHLEIIRAGMIAVVQGERGTGRKAAVLGHTIAGKTGTAQVGKDHRIGWFTGYGPAKQPNLR